jgi:hypothetical protein
VGHAFGVFRTYEVATTSTIVRSSWEKAGFGSVRCDGACYFWVDEGRIRASPGDEKERASLASPMESVPQRIPVEAELEFSKDESSQKTANRPSRMRHIHDRTREILKTGIVLSQHI